MQPLRTMVAFGMCTVLMMAGAAPADEPTSLQKSEPNTSPVRLMSAQQDRLFRQCLPSVDNSHVQRVLDDPRIILYTEKEMPKAYQLWIGDLQGVHAASYNISANGSEPFGNGNREFPWDSPGGAHRVSNLKTFRFLWLPLDEDGNTLPVIWFRERFRGDATYGYGWLFPKGAIVGEVLMMRAADGHDYTFELRLRIRERNNWGVNVFRPFPTAADLAKRIKELRSNWREQPALVAQIRHLEEPLELQRLALADQQHDRHVFMQSMGVDTLPPLDDDALVAELLQKTEFTSALGARWRKGTNGIFTAAPTTEAPFHIVPAKYDAGFIEVNRTSCIRCHDSVNQHVRNFNFGRDWYGRIRGSDGIFSFHPFDPSTVSYNGYGGSVRLRQELIDGGVLEPHDPKRHSPEIYNRLPFLE